MNKSKVIEFFDRLSTSWDADMIRNEEVIKRILDNAGICRDVSVLDVACGTGVLIPDYMERGVSHVTAIDISPKMIGIARKKFSHIDNAEFLCADAYEHTFTCRFDRIMIYNAFPHFAKPEELIKRLSSLLSDGGILSVAHGMSKAQIDAIHDRGAGEVSIKLLDIDALSDIFEKYTNVTVRISDDSMYQICGTKK